MRQSIFEQITFVCPLCRQAGIKSELALAEVAVQDQEYVLEGLIGCNSCQARFPIVSGVPVVLRDLESWWRGSRKHLTHAGVHSNLLGDFFAELDRRGRIATMDWSIVSTYVQSHYAGSGGNQDFWAEVTGVVPEKNASLPSLDLGCAAGRMTFELAAQSSIGVGLDMDFRLVEAAAQIQRQGRVEFHRVHSAKRVRPDRVSFEAPGNTLFLVGDALDPPFGPEAFGTVAALNLLDNVSVPLTLLAQMDALLVSGGRLLLCSPYQWRPDIADPAQWLESEELAADQFVRAVLCQGRAGNLNLNYTIERQNPDVEWLLIQNERQSRRFRVDLLLARKD